MFILLFGLLGVMSMFPAGKWHVSKAERYDRAASIGQAAFNEIQVRGLLKPASHADWVDPTGAPSNPTPLAPWAIDPYAPPGAANVWSNAGLEQHTLAGFTTTTAADALFRSRDDLTVEYPTDGDLPSIQLQAADGYRSFDGHYSWCFTAVKNGSNSTTMTVSVPVFQKRDLQAETTIGCTLTGGVGGGEVTIPAATGIYEDQIKPGNWVLISSSAPNEFSRWYRIIAIDDDGTNKNFTVVGPDFQATTTPKVSLFDSVVAVYEKTMTIEEHSQWGH